MTSKSPDREPAVHAALAGGGISAGGCVGGSIARGITAFRAAPPPAAAYLTDAYLASTATGPTRAAHALTRAPGGGGHGGGGGGGGGCSLRT